MSPSLIFDDIVVGDAMNTRIHGRLLLTRKVLPLQLQPDTPFISHRQRDTVQLPRVYKRGEKKESKMKQKLRPI